LKDAVEATQGAERGEEGHLTIGYVGAAAYHLLPNVLRNYRREYPRVALYLHDMRTAEQLDALARGGIDVGLMRPTTLPAELESTVVLREPFVVALPAEHPLAARPRVDVRALAAEAFVAFPATAQLGLHRQICELCHTAGFEPRVVQTANETRSIVGLVGAGFGVSIVTASAQRMQISGVVYRPLRGVRRYVDMVAVWPKARSSAVARRFVNAIRRGAATLTPV
jgi:DNA-binding transcriptional LysR family regulator